jgi:hypothetical protein
MNSVTSIAWYCWFQFDILSERWEAYNWGKRFQMIWRALTECVHGLSSLSVNTVNMHVLSRTRRLSVCRLVIQQNHYRMISRNALNLKETCINQRNDLVSPAGSNHLQFNEFGFEPNPTSLRPDVEWGMLATRLRSQSLKLEHHIQTGFLWSRWVAIEYTWTHCHSKGILLLEIRGDQAWHILQVEGYRRSKVWYPILLKWDRHLNV